MAGAAMFLGEYGIWRRETIHHMGRRCRNWDYKSRAIYEITVVLKDRRRAWLGEIHRAENGAAQDRESVVRGCANSGRRGEREWFVEPTADGSAVIEALLEMPRLYPQVSLIEWQLMPDHFHFVVFVREPLPLALGALIRGFKAGAAKRWKNRRENAAAQDQAANTTGRPEWAEGFVDTILWHAGQLENMINYLLDNPRRAALKRANPELFRQVADLAIPLCRRENAAAQDRESVVHGCENAAAQNRECVVQNRECVVQGRENAAAQNRECVAQNRENAAAQNRECVVQGQCENGVGDVGGSVPSRFREGLVGHFAALGNQFLLGRPLAQVQISRRFFAYKRVAKPGGGLKIARSIDGEPVVAAESAEYRELRDALFAAAEHGAVLLSPCVSDGERQIAREALAAKLPLITMQNKGFSRIHKPAGRYFDACTEGRLLMLAPAAWPYTPGEKPMTRFDAAAMNRLCQLIAGEEAAEIDYHGMKPTNIDELAYAAAKVERRDS